MRSTRRPRPRTYATALVLALAPTAAVGVAGAVPVSAAPPTIVVNTWDDELNADGDCSLREAIATLNTGAAVDACAVPVDPVIEIPGTVEALTAPLTVSQTMTIRGTSVVPANLSCAAVVGNCIENVGAGSDLDLENLWVSMASGDQVYAALGAGHLHLSDVNVWGGAGGVVSQGGDIDLARSTVWDTTDWGIFSLTGTITVDHGTVGGNDAGAVYGDLADITISSSAIYHNEGYGVFGQSGDVEIVSSTIADNGADASRTHDGTVTYRSATVVGNRRALNVTGPGATRFSNTVVARSDLGNCDNPVTSLGFNVSDDDSCAFDQATDRTGIDPGLGLLDDLTATPTIPLLEGSALIDTGGDCLPLDQVDAVRPTDGDGDGTAACDVGAVEAPGVAAPPAAPTPDPADPSAPGTTRPAEPATPVSARPSFTG